MKYSSFISSILIAMILLGGISCLTSSSQAPSLVQVNQELQSDKQRVTSPVTSQSDLTALVDGNNIFAFNTYQSLKDNTNLFFCPYSISLALAMTYAGARGDTEQQMAETLHFNLPQERLHPSFNSLDLELSQRGQGAKGKDNQGFRLNIVNAIWGQEGFTFLQNFLDTLAQNYGAGIRLLDFQSAPEASRVAINNWVSDQTEGRIKALIPQGAIDPMTRLVLTDAIYFNAAWQYPFEKSATCEDTFYLLNGNEVNVPMMHQTESFAYTEGNDYQAVELPYDGRELSMLVLLPQPGQFTSFEDSINSDKVVQIINSLDTKKIALSMPKFEFSSDFSLKDTLSALGMPVAFSGNADFSGMDGKRDLQISDVIHKAFVSVDESGTEAAAATAVIIRLTSAPMPEQIISMTIDRPFIFLLRDIQTGTILFIGDILNPVE
jgi:serpin B